MSSYSDQSSQSRTATAHGEPPPASPVMPVIDDNGFAIAGFCCAVFAALFAWIPIIGWVVSPIWFCGILCSFIGLYKALFDGRKYSKLASAGIMFSLLGTVLWWLGLNVLFAGTGVDDASPPVDDAGVTEDIPAYEDDTSIAPDDSISDVDAERAAIVDAARAAIFGYAPGELSGHGDDRHSVIWPGGTVLEVSFTGDSPCAEFEVSVMAPMQPGEAIPVTPYSVVTEFCVEDYSGTIQLASDVGNVLIFSDGFWSITARWNSDVVTSTEPPDVVSPAGPPDLVLPPLPDAVSPPELSDDGGGQYEVNWPRRTLLTVFFTSLDGMCMDFMMVLTYANGDVDQVVTESCVEDYFDLLTLGEDVSLVTITTDGLWWIDAESFTP